MLKLNYIACAGFNIYGSVSYGGVPLPNGPQIIDVCIYFYTSNIEFIQLPNNIRIRGWGYAISTHVSTTPVAVYVATSYDGVATATAPQTYEFYVAMPYFVGNPIVTAATSGTWTPNLNDGSGSLSVPVNAIKLPIASNMTSMVRNYVTMTGGALY